MLNSAQESRIWPLLLLKNGDIGLNIMSYPIRDVFEAVLIFDIVNV